MDDLIKVINDICMYGEQEQPAENIEAIRNTLKKRLYTIASKSVGSSDMSFADLTGKYKRLKDKDIKPYLAKNLPSFGYYHIVLNPLQLATDPELALGDAIDDFCDVIKDLAEVRWRIKHISELDGLSFLKHIFSIHTESHIIDLICYLTMLDE